MPERKKIVGTAMIDRAIKSINGIIENVNERVHEVALAIVEHADGAGNGDVSRALTLCQMTKRHKSINTNFLVGWFAAFAGTNVNLNKGTVNLFSKDSKKQRGFRVAEAKANKWFEAIDNEGNRAAWYAGPQPEEYTPEGIGGVADTLHRTVKRLAERLDDTKKVNGKEVPLYKLTAEQRTEVDNALAFIDRISATLARQESVAALKQQLEAAVADAGQDDDVLNVINPKEEAVA